MTDLGHSEALFFSVLDDLKDYLGDVVLVGGWLPFIYSNYCWKVSVKSQVTTVDVDFGLGRSILNQYPKTIFESLSRLDYTERHISMDRMLPVVLYKAGEMPVEFISYPHADTAAVIKVLGGEIHLNRIDGFEFLLEHTMRLDVSAMKKNEPFKIYVPKPSAFLYHKAATFVSREDEQKQAKDLYYAYFILRYAPDIDAVLADFSSYGQSGIFSRIKDNLNEYFGGISSRGCLMVERENGPDDYLAEVRQDIFERFKQLRQAI